MDSEDHDFVHALDNLYRQEFELLRGMFEGHFSSDVIAGVLEDCDGDVNLAVDTLTRIEDSSSTTVNVALDDPSTTIDTQIERSISPVPVCHNSDMDFTNAHNNSTAPSDAAAFQSTHASAMASTSAAKNPPRVKNIMPKVDYWTPQFKNIIKCYNEGARILVLMRGAPGCGKTYLARVLVESTVGTTDSNNFANHIFSADDLMEINGIYHYSVHRLSEVHTKNQARVLKAVNEGRSPVIVDNTNMAIWEMFPYTRDAVKNGYIIEVIEPSNPWSKKPSQLAKRNIHGVPIEKIQAMLQRYEGTHNGKSLVKYFKLYYPKGMEPPVLRKIPAFHKKVISLAPDALKLVTENSIGENQQVHAASAKSDLKSLQSDHSNIDKIPCTLNVNGILNSDESSSSEDPVQPQNTEAVKKMDEMLKVEVEWENGEEWDTVKTNNKPKTNAACSSEPKPPRSEANARPGKFIEPSMINDDWTKNLMFMQPEHAASAATGVLVDVGDFINNQHKNVGTIPNNIENNDIKSQEDNNVIDNGTIAHKTLFSGFHKCDQTDKFFINLRKMFKNVPRAVLREIYDNCAGDGNWACSIVLDGIRNKTIETVNTDLSDSEEEVRVECQCEEHYDEVPTISTEATLAVFSENKTTSSTPLHKKKTKKDKIVTEESSQVLQNIKKSIQFSENHYSQHYLNRKKNRDDIKEQVNGEQASSKNENSGDTNFANSSQTENINELPTSASLPGSSLDQIPLPDSSQNILYRDIPSTSSAETYAVPTTSASRNLESTDADDEFEDDDNDTIGSDDEKSEIGDNRNVIVNIGMDFVKTLDELYGRHDFEYPEGVKPILSIPSKILYDLNALWVESITHQLDKVHTQTGEMIQQDEEFARQVEIQLQLEADEAEEILSEEENARALPETSKPQSTVPNFKEIMDTELALSIYEKEVKEEWKNKEPQDLAAQMTRKKLYEIFPDVASETLSELLIAHGNSFDATVEILMISTGQEQYLDQPNGINKFVMEKEIENKEKALMEEQKAALDDDDYPYLFKPGTEQVELTMDTVNVMRKKADIHKNARDIFFQKAKWYYENKRFAEASCYSQIAALHTARYDKASHYAAAILVQYHANIHPEANVIDLHFLRVPEAENSLDLFIDDRLRKIRQTPQTRSLVLRVITGRGKHSPGRARIKPAIMKRLHARGLKFRQQNPGLLEVRLKPTNLLTVELQNT